MYVILSRNVVLLFVCFVCFVFKHACIPRIKPLIIPLIKPLIILLSIPLSIQVYTNIYKYLQIYTNMNSNTNTNNTSIHVCTGEDMLNGGGMRTWAKDAEGGRVC